MSFFDFKVGSAILKNLPNIFVVVLVAYVVLFLIGDLKEFTNIFTDKMKFFNDQQITSAQRQIDELNRKYKELQDNIVRSQTQILSEKEMKQVIKETVSPLILAQIEKDNADIVALSETIARLEGNIKMAIKSEMENSGLTTTGEEFELYTDYVRFKEQDGNPGIRVAQVNFDAKDTANPWTIVTEDLLIKSKSVSAQQPSGNYEHFVELEAYNKSDPNYNTKPYRIKIDSSVYYQRKLKANRFFLWAPHLEGGLGANYSVAAPIYGFDIGISASAYGKTKDDNYFRFLRLAIGLSNKDVYGSIFPAGMNLKFLNLPLFRDTWLYPGLALRNGHQPGIAASVVTTF